MDTQAIYARQYEIEQERDALQTMAQNGEFRIANLRKFLDPVIAKRAMFVTKHRAAGQVPPAEGLETHDLMVETFRAPVTRAELDVRFARSTIAALDLLLADLDRQLRSA